MWKSLVEFHAMTTEDALEKKKEHAARPNGLSCIRIGGHFTRTWLRYVRVYAVAYPSVVCNIRASYSAGYNFRQWQTPLALAIRWPPCRTLRRSSKGTLRSEQRRRKQIESGWARILARSAVKKFFFCAPPPLFCRAHLVWGGTAHTRVGTKMGSHSPLFVRKEMAKESTF